MGVSAEKFCDEAVNRWYLSCSLYCS